MHAASRSWRSRTSARRRGNIKRNGTDRRRDDAARRGATRVRSGRPITLRFRATLPSLNVAAARIAGHVNAHQCFIDTRARARSRGARFYARRRSGRAARIETRRRVIGIDNSFPPSSSTALHCIGPQASAERKRRREGGRENLLAAFVVANQSGRYRALSSRSRADLGCGSPLIARDIIHF
jgi:hypothetical protein